MPPVSSHEALVTPWLKELTKLDCGPRKAKVRAELQRMVSPGPGNVVDEIVNRKLKDSAPHDGQIGSITHLVIVQRAEENELLRIVVSNPAETLARESPMERVQNGVAQGSGIAH